MQLASLGVFLFIDYKFEANKRPSTWVVIVCWWWSYEFRPLRAV